MQPDPRPHPGLRSLIPAATIPAATPDLAAPATLLLVRHGRTEATGVRLCGGDTPGPPLTAEGEAEVRALAPLLPPVDAVIASPTVRTLATADLLGAGPPVEDAGFVETLHGAWDGSTHAELAAREPEAYRAWMLSPSLGPPGGESIEQLAARVLAARDRVVREHAGRTVLVVTHTGPIRALVAAALDAGPVAFWRLRVRPAGLTVLRFWADGGAEVAAVNAGPPEMIRG